jgi:hypothetical protein
VRTTGSGRATYARSARQRRRAVRGGGGGGATRLRACRKRKAATQSHTLCGTLQLRPLAAAPHTHRVKRSRHVTEMHACGRAVLHTSTGAVRRAWVCRVRATRSRTKKERVTRSPHAGAGAPLLSWLHARDARTVRTARSARLRGNAAAHFCCQGGPRGHSTNVHLWCRRPWRRASRVLLQEHGGVIAARRGPVVVSSWGGEEGKQT